MITWRNEFKPSSYELYTKMIHNKNPAAHGRISNVKYWLTQIKFEQKCTKEKNVCILAEWKEKIFIYDGNFKLQACGRRQNEKTENICISSNFRLETKFKQNTSVKIFSLTEKIFDSFWKRKKNDWNCIKQFLFWNPSSFPVLKLFYFWKFLKTIFLKL